MPDIPSDTHHGLWSLVSQKLEQRVGLHFGPAQASQLERGLRAAAHHFGCADAHACAQWLLSNDHWAAADVQVLAKHLAIGESYFFRDETFFQNLERSILPELLRKRRAAGCRLRIWSAACSTGEEPYSVAMLLAGMIADWREWDISILASDINEHALRRARAGVYGAWSLRSGLPGHCRNFLIAREGGRYEVDPAIRGMVSFAHINLAQDEYPSAANATAGIDLVLCRNVLIYFKPERARSVLAGLARSLVPDGWLATSAVEMPLADVPGLDRVELPGAVILRRECAAARPRPAPRAGDGARQRMPLEAVRLPERKTTPRPSRRATAKSENRVADSPAPVAGLAALARAHADKGELADAALLCAQAIEAEKGNADLAYLLATILLEQGDLAQASAALRRTLYLSPRHVLAHLALGGMARRQGNAQTTGRHLSRAMAQLSVHEAQDVLLASGGMSARQLQAAIGAVTGGKP